MSISGTLIYTVSTSVLTGISPQDNTTLCPIVNASSSFTLTPPVITVLDGTSSVAIGWSYTTITDSDGLKTFSNTTFSSSLNSAISLRITQFDGVPLSRGGLQFQSFAGQFTATDAPTILSNTSARQMFRNCTNFNSNINSWNTINITDMSEMFNGCSAFNNNGIALNWNTSSVTV